MKKRLPALLLALLLGCTTLLAACGDSTETNGDDNTTSAAESTEDSSGEPTTDTVEIPTFEELVFPEVPPTSYEMYSGDVYAYDDLTQTYDLTIVQHNYGSAGDPEYDVVRMWLEEKFNLNITMETYVQGDLEAIMSAKAAALDLPDVFWGGFPPSGDAFTRELYAQGLLVDAREIYPLMPQSNQFVTQSMIEWSKVDGVEGLPFITKYGIQDGVWGFAIREDWLATLEMEKPTTKDELIAYAVAVTEEDPDGNGQDDTYFMTGAGSGTSWGMLNEFSYMFGNPQVRVEDGELYHPIFEGNTKDFLLFINELYTLDVLAPDWFTVEWEAAKAVTLNDKVGMLHYPAGALFTEYGNAKGDKTAAQGVWSMLSEAPIEGGMYQPAGNPGYTWAFTKSGFEEEGKLERVAHMIDTMTMGGENFFQSIQSSVDEVYEAAGLNDEIDFERIYGYNDNQTFYLSSDSTSVFWPAAADATTKWAAIGPWQTFGLNVSWQREYVNPDDAEAAKNAEFSNEANDAVLGLERWPNSTLISTIPTATIAPEINDFELQNHYAFVSGERSFDEWEAYQQEWLDAGGRDVIAAYAEKLGVAVPDYAQ